MHPVIPIRERLYHEDPYEGFEPRYSEIKGWNSRHPKLADLIHETKPQLIIEIGTWLGASALFMAENTDAHILCIDTWLGAAEMWDNKADPDRYGALRIEHGTPTIYEDFLSNILRAGKQEQITPWRVPSNIALRLLNQWGYKPDLVYIDGSHEYADVKQDVSLSAQLFPRIICGDDYHSWLGVKKAVNEWFPDARKEEDGFWYVDRLNRVSSAAVE